MSDNMKIENFLKVLKGISVDSADEQIILGGFANAGSKKPKILVIGGPTGDPMSLLPIDEPMFGEADAPLFPVEVTFGQSLAIRLNKGNTVHEFVRAEDFCNASLDGAESCIVESASKLLRDVDLRFCLLDSDPDREYESSFFAKLTDGCSGCIFVLGAGDGALLNNVGKFCTWVADMGVFTGNAALILNHVEYDSPNPFLAAMLKESLHADRIASVAATAFREYADEELDIYFADEALKIAVSAVASQEHNSDVDEVIEKCRLSVSRKIERENQRLILELNEATLGIRIRSKVIESFPPYAMTVLPSAGIILTDEKKQNIYDDCHRFLLKLHDSIPALIKECAECSPDTYKADLVSFASDYLLDVTNRGIKAFMDDIVRTMANELEQKFGEIRTEFLTYIKDAPELDVTAKSKTDFLNCVNVMASNYVQTSVTKLMGGTGYVLSWAAGRGADMLLGGSGKAVKMVVQEIWKDFIQDPAAETLIKHMPQKIFLNDTKKRLQKQILESADKLGEMLDQHVYPKLTGYLEDAYDGLIKDYCKTIMPEKEALEQNAAALREKLAELETDLKNLNINKM